LTHTTRAMVSELYDHMSKAMLSRWELGLVRESHKEASIHG